MAKNENQGQKCGNCFHWQHTAKEWGECTALPPTILQDMDGEPDSADRDCMESRKPCIYWMASQ